MAPCKHVYVETVTIRQPAQGCEGPYLQGQLAADVEFEPKMTQLDEKLQVLTVQTQKISEVYRMQKFSGLSSIKQKGNLGDKPKIVQNLKTKLMQEGFEYLSKCHVQQAQQDNKIINVNLRITVGLFLTQRNYIEAACQGPNGVATCNLQADANGC